MPHYPHSNPFEMFLAFFFSDKLTLPDCFVISSFKFMVCGKYFVSPPPPKGCVRVVVCLCVSHDCSSLWRGRPSLTSNRRWRGRWSCSYKPCASSFSSKCKVRPREGADELRSWLIVYVDVRGGTRDDGDQAGRRGERDALLIPST